MKSENRWRHIIVELGAHLPYSIFGVIVGVIILGLLTFFAVILKVEDILPQAAEQLFHVFHPIHVLLSAIVTTAMFWKHERHFIKTLFVGFLGSITICGISDMLVPYFGGKVLATGMTLHICILEHPYIIIPFAVIGVLIGFLVPGAIEKSTEFSHSIHVLVSSMASILYLVSFGIGEWIHMVGGIFLVTVIAVMLPCCLSDIAIPLFFIDSEKR
jgi:hypothetical protein